MEETINWNCRAICESSKRDSLSGKENNWWKHYEIYSVVAVRIEALEGQ